MNTKAANRIAAAFEAEIASATTPRDCEELKLTLRIAALTNLPMHVRARLLGEIEDRERALRVAA